MIRGIVPVYARKLVEAFGAAVFDLIEAEPDQLREVTGVGPKRAARIVAGWAEQKVIREIMLFLHDNGVGTSRAVRIYKLWCQRHSGGYREPLTGSPATSAASAFARPTLWPVSLGSSPPR
jgi:NAD-dependent DNA ligase